MNGLPGRPPVVVPTHSSVEDAPAGKADLLARHASPLTGLRRARPHADCSGAGCAAGQTTGSDGARAPASAAVPRSTSASARASSPTAARSVSGGWL